MQSSFSSYALKWGYSAGLILKSTLSIPVQIFSETPLETVFGMAFETSIEFEMRMCIICDISNLLVILGCYSIMKVEKMT